MQKAYELLKLSQPKNEIEKSIKEFFLENIPEDLGMNSALGALIGIPKMGFNEDRFNKI
jgi:hypothetical protein